jgi:hypothetical protein
MLRTWETRYGWPNPKRLPNGYRAYCKELIDDIVHAGELVGRGTHIDLLIKAGVYVGRDAVKDPVKVRTTLDGIELPRPSYPESASIQRIVVTAIERLSSDVLLMVQDSTIVQPADRESAVLMPAAMWVARMQAQAVNGSRSDLARRLAITLHSTLGRRAMCDLFSRAAKAVGDADADVERLTALATPKAPPREDLFHEHEPSAQPHGDPISDTYVQGAITPDTTPTGDDIPQILAARMDRGSVIVVDDPTSTVMRDALDDAEADDKVVVVAIADPDIPTINGDLIDRQALAKLIGVKSLTLERLIVLAFDPRRIRRSRAIEAFLKARDASDPSLMPDCMHRLNHEG